MIDFFLNKDIRNIVIGTIITSVILWAAPHLYAYLKGKVTDVSYGSSLSSVRTWVTTNLHISLTTVLLIITVILTLLCAIWIHEIVGRKEPVKWTFDHFLSMGQLNEKGSMVWRIRCFNIQGINITDRPIKKIDGYIEVDRTGERFPIKLTKDGNIVEASHMLALPPNEQIDIFVFFSNTIKDYSAWKGFEPSEFVARYCPFTFITILNGKQYKHRFSMEHIKAFIDKRISSSVPTEKGPVFKSREEGEHAASTQQSRPQQKDAAINWCNKQEKPMAPKVFAEAVERLEAGGLLDNRRIRVKLLIRKNDGTDLFGSLGGHGRSSQHGYHYDIVSENGTSQKIFFSDINTVSTFEITKYD